jgi:hypothetical protein
VNLDEQLWSPSGGPVGIGERVRGSFSGALNRSVRLIATTRELASRLKLGRGGKAGLSMTTAHQGGPGRGRPQSPSAAPSGGPAGRGRATGEPINVRHWPAPEADRPTRPRLDGWAGPPPQPDADDGDGPQSRYPRWLLPAAALAVVAALGLAAAVLVTGGGGEATSEVGTVRFASGARVRTSDGSEPRALEDGEAVLYGWSVEAGDGPGVTIDLAGGGVLRFDGGATLTFTAASEFGEPRPSVDIAGGRTWFNPTGSESDALVLRTDVITLSSTRNPVALDCTVDCTVEAPAGGVNVSAEPGVNVAPATDEALTVTSDGGLAVRTIPQPSAWTHANLEADAVALPAPEPAPLDGVTAGAVPAAAYAFDLAVTSDGEGAALDPSVMFWRGQTAHYEATIDTGSCAQVPCDVTVAATSERVATTLRLSGSFHIADRSMALTLNRPVDCPGSASRSAGTVTITVDMTVSEAAYDESSQRWIATVMGGPGTSVAEISDASCLASANLVGTRTNELEMTGRAAG